MAHRGSQLCGSLLPHGETDCPIWPDTTALRSPTWSSKTGCKSSGELEMTCSTSAVAVCCCSDFAELVEQAGVLDGDDGLRREILDQLDLFVGERPHLLAVNADYADQFVVLEHRHGNEGTGTADVSERSDRRITIEVGLGRSQIIDMHYLLRSCDPSRDCCGDRDGLPCPGECPRRRVGRYAARQRGTPRRHRD